MKNFRDYEEKERRNYITLSTGEYYPDILADACRLYTPVLEIFSKLLHEAESSTALFMNISLVPNQWMRTQLTRIFRKYVSPETPVEMLKKSSKAKQICSEFGDRFRKIQIKRKIFHFPLNTRGKKILILFATTSDFINRQQQYAYSDNLTGGEYVEFLRERIILVKELLADTGSIYLHLDNKMAFTMKVIMDEIFGIKNFRAFITRKKCSTKNYTKNTYGNVSDYILFYTKTDNYIWNRPYTPWDLEKMLEEYPCVDEKTGKRYKKIPIHAPGTRNGETGKEWNGMLPPHGKHWQFTPEKLDELNKRGEIYWSPTGNPRRKVFCEPQKGIPIQDIWLNYRDSINQSLKTTGYPTEKNIDMLKMIVEASSNHGDIVLDCFAGSGTTLDAAFQKNRHWIGVDNSIESLKAIAVRFISGMKIYGDYVNHTHNKFDNPQFDFFEICNFSVWGEEKNEKELESIFIKQTNEKLIINE